MAGGSKDRLVVVGSVATSSLALVAVFAPAGGTGVAGAVAGIWASTCVVLRLQKDRPVDDG